MANVLKERIPMREQDPKTRKNNFQSVPLGYNEDEAMREASRCLQCPEPECEKGCPVKIGIKEMIHKIAEGKFKEAYDAVVKDNPFPSMAGRVCPQEDQCEGRCILGNMGDPINIGKLEAFIGDWASVNLKINARNVDDNKGKVAIIGSGPAGISCAADLKKMGYQVDIFEALHIAGGVLQYGIPAFRLPKDIVDNDIDYLRNTGVDIKTNSIVGQNIDLNELRNKYDAIFIGTGAGAPRFLSIKGEELNGVYSANEFLIRINLMKSYKFPEYDTPIVKGDKIGVIGAGNVAMDAARSALRMGAKTVKILYRRTMAYSPARDEEIMHASEEGIIFEELVSPVEIIGNSEGWVTGLKLAKMELSDSDGSGRPKPIKISGSEYIEDLDILINAIGTKPNRLFLDKYPELRKASWGGIKVNDSYRSNIENIFAGGDAISGGATVIQALGEGRKAAEKIDEYING